MVEKYLNYKADVGAPESTPWRQSQSAAGLSPHLTPVLTQACAGGGGASALRPRAHRRRL